MFDWIKKISKNRSSALLGHEEYVQFKDMSRDPELMEYLTDVCAGITSVPSHKFDDVQKMIGLVQSLRSYTGLEVWDIIEYAEAGEWDTISNKLEQTRASMTTLRANSVDGLERLRQWAKDNNLPKLSKLETPAYQMTGFPRDIDKIINLRQLHLPNAGLDTLPSEIKFMTALESILITGNDIKILPPELFSIPTLRRIDADNNKIESIPDQILHAKNLQLLDLDENNIIHLPKCMEQCTSLNRLLLRNQHHGTALNHPDSPLSSAAVDALFQLELRGCNIRY